MTHNPIVAQALYYCIVAIVPTPQPRKPQTCNSITFMRVINGGGSEINPINCILRRQQLEAVKCFTIQDTYVL
jgi:hypothetical protein